MVTGWQKYFRAKGVGYELLFVGSLRDHCGMSEKEGNFIHSNYLSEKKRNTTKWRASQFRIPDELFIDSTGKKMNIIFSRTNLNIGTGGCCGRGGANQWKNLKNSRLLLHSYLISYAHFQSKYIDLYIIYLNSVNFFKNG
jgi:hypothetical protein